MIIFSINSKIDKMTPIISPSDLKNLPTENLIILDARTGKDIKQNYLERHIKGARFIDLDKDLAEIGEGAAFGGRHPLPSVEKFAETLSNLGIAENSHIIVYDDNNASNAAARAWWMLRSFGFEKVQVLDGGMQAAEKNGLEFSSGEETFEKASLIKKEHWFLPVSSLEVVENELKNNSSTVIDVRDAYRYKGESEPIDLVAGHIPGAINVPKAQWANPKGLEKGKTNVVYCYTAQCHLAANACARFAGMGYPVMEMDGGFEVWKEHELDIEEASANRFGKKQGQQQQTQSFRA